MCLLWIVLSCRIVYVMMMTIYNFQPIYVETPISIILISYQLLATNNQPISERSKQVLQLTLQFYTPIVILTIQPISANTL